MSHEHTPGSGHPQHHHQGAQPAAETSAAPGQFGELGQTGQGVDLTARMEATPPPPGAGEPDLIPWDPTGKIDDEVERRSQAATPAGLGAPKGGGEQPVPAEVGPGRYGGATDEAPTSPVEGATTTLAAHAADDSPPSPAEAGAAETWAGGQATQEVMQAPAEFAHQPPPPSGPAPHSTTHGGGSSRGEGE